MVELVDTLDLGSSAERRGGSSPSARTISELTILITAHGHNWATKKMDVTMQIEETSAEGLSRELKITVAKDN